MWEKIKNFFKWIADHTGISWIARKISSGWKWLFGGKANATQQNTSQQEGPSGNERQEPAQANGQSKDTTAPKTPVPSGPTPTVEPEGLKTPSDDSSVNQSTPLPYEPLKTTTQEPAQPTLDEKSQESVVNKREEGELKLNTALNGIDLSLKQALVVKDYKSHNVNADKLFTELLIYIKCGKDEYRVVGSTSGNPISIFNVPIVSIVKKNENGEYLDSNKYLVDKDVKKMLGLKDDVTTVKVDSISNSPFEAETLEQPVSGSEVASSSGSQFTTADSNEPKSERIETATLEQPNSNDNIFNQQSAGPGGLFQSNDKEPQPTTPNQLVNQDNIAGQDSSKIGETQNSPTTDLTTEQSTSSADKEKFFDAEVDGVAQPTPSAVPNEPQETLVNAHEEKGEPNNAASNEEVQSEVSNKEVAAEEQAPNLNKNVDSKGGLGSEVSDNEGFEGAIKQPESLEVQEDEVANDMQNQGQSQNSNGMADPLAKPDQGSGDEPNQSSFDNESVKDDDKEADNPQPEISANGSAPTDSSSFDIVSSQETTPDELQEPDEDKELARQSEADQKAPANDDGPNSLVAKPEVQTASNDLSHKSQSQ